MANIYEQQAEPLHTLLDRASARDGATVVIPDLQRPFVWQPGQVTLLIDSLVRGWPFGTLLMWKVDHEELRAIPHREFWQVVDRTGDGQGATVIRRDPPASYHMVLDGQQRVQSLLLALCGDGWGFCLEDRDWVEHSEGTRPKGRRPKYPHWSKGTLCFDVEAFLQKYDLSSDVIGIDYRDVLVWAITDPSNGQSDWTKPDNYREPLCRAYAPENRGKLIRLGRLWAAVQPNPNLKEKQFREAIAPFLQGQGVADDTIEKLLTPMGELMTTLRDVKLSKVTYLELRPFDDALWTEDEYNDAIVNIFTRLNTAGRTLTREEITFAWLKMGWDDKATGGRTAGACFDSLLQEVRDRGLPVEMDDLVRTVSFMWAVLCRNGEMLSDKDLLKGPTVQPMAGDLARVWDDVVSSFVTVLDTARERDLRYGRNGQYYSVNALTVLWTWYLLSRNWVRANHLNNVPRDSYDKAVSSLLNDHIDRWLVCSHWAGRWGGSSSGVLAGYANDLCADHKALAKEHGAKPALAVLSRRMTVLIDDISTDAMTHVQTFSVDRRERVSRYGSLLWVWHRLDKPRWAMSSIPLRTGRRKKCDFDVDHTVAHALWEKKVKALPPKDSDAESELMQEINALGNCALLEKTFNISKSAKPLKEFLDEVHEFKNGQVVLTEWSNALQLANCMVDSSGASTDQILEAIRKRETRMRQELVEFVQGKRLRQDA